MSLFALLAVAIGVAWWWLSRVRVTPVPTALMPTRIVFPGGIHLADHTKALTHLRNPEEIVIPFEHAVLVIDLPLTHPASIELDAPVTVGFTRAELVKQVAEAYAHVYEAEEETAVTKTIPVDERGTLRNRNRTDGVYGIWGHDLADLTVTAARWTRSEAGKVTIELHVEH